MDWEWMDRSNRWRDRRDLRLRFRFGLPLPLKEFWSLGMCVVCVSNHGSTADVLSFNEEIGEETSRSEWCASWKKTVSSCLDGLRMDGQIGSMERQTGFEIAFGMRFTFNFGVILKFWLMHHMFFKMWAKCKCQVSRRGSWRRNDHNLMMYKLENNRFESGHVGLLDWWDRIDGIHDWCWDSV